MITHPLARLLAPREPIVVHEGSGSPEPGATITCEFETEERFWLHRDGWRLFARAATGAGPNAAVESIGNFMTTSGEPLQVTISEDGGVVVPFSLADALDSYLSESWRTGATPAQLSSGQLDVYYRVKRMIPRRVQLAARRTLIRRQGVPDFPRWPLDDSVLRLLHFFVACVLATRLEEQLRFAWFWPAPYDAAVILTHDVESAEGLRLCIDLADLEEAHGFRSSFNIVADWYPIDDGVVRELRRRGFEIGVHGVHHDRSMFSNRETFEAQQPAVRAAANRFGAVGFRSPATHRVFKWLGDLPLDYDSSIPNSDPFEPQPGGCCSPWPFFIGDLVELPYTLPQDHTLLTLLRHDGPELWLEQVNRIRARHGLVQSVTHPDPGYLGDADKRAVYREFVERLAGEANLWRALPREVAAWWRDRDAGRTDVTGVATLDGDKVRLMREPAPGG
jgi:hypothetical protein